MKTILKTLGITAGIYGIATIGCVMGVWATSWYYEDDPDFKSRKELCESIESMIKLRKLID